MTPDIPDPGSPEPGAPAPDASQPVPPLVAVEVRAAPVAGFRARLEWRDREIWLRLPGGPRSYWQALQSAAAQLRNDSVVRWLYEHAPAPGAERAEGAGSAAPAASPPAPGPAQPEPPAPRTRAPGAAGRQVVRRRVQMTVTLGHFLARMAEAAIGPGAAGGEVAISNRTFATLTDEERRHLLARVREHGMELVIDDAVASSFVRILAWEQVPLERG